MLPRSYQILSFMRQVLLDFLRLFCLKKMLCPITNPLKLKFQKKKILNATTEIRSPVQNTNTLPKWLFNQNVMFSTLPITAIFNKPVYWPRERESGLNILDLWFMFLNEAFVDEDNWAILSVIQSRYWKNFLKKSTLLNFDKNRSNLKIFF